MSWTGSVLRPPDGLRARLTVTFGGLTLVAVVVFAVVIAGTIERLLVNRLAQDLVAQAGLIAGQVAEDLANGDQRTVARALVLIDNETTARGLVVDALGRLVGATEIEQREGLGRRNDDVGLSAALAGQNVSVVLPRSGPESEVLYVALPIVWQDRVVGAIRLAYTLRDIEATIRQINIGIAVGAIVTVAIAAALSAGLASAITTPIRALSHATRGPRGRRARPAAGPQDSRRGRRARRSVQPDGGPAARVRDRAPGVRLGRVA